MTPRTADRAEALKRAALAALLEAADKLVPGFGPLRAGWEAYREALQPDTLDGRVQAGLRKMSGDFQKLLAAELQSRPGETAALALQETLEILKEAGLSAEELVSAAGLDPERAARRTLERAAGRLRLLEEPLREVVERTVGTYYRVLLDHREAFAHVGIPALGELLRRTGGLEERFIAALDLHRRREAWNLLLPLYTPPAEPPTGEVRLWELKAQCALIPFTGREQEALRDEMAGWARGLKGLRKPLGLRILTGPGGAGKTRLLVEVGRVLEAEGWQARFIPDRLSPMQLEASAPHWVRPDRPTLLVLDYADSRLRETETLLRTAARAPSPGRPLALVLLMRRLGDDLRRLLTDYTGADVGWVRFVETVAAEALGAVRPLPDLVEEDRPTLFHKARDLFRARLPVPPVPVDYDPEDLPTRPLPLILLALLAAHGRRVASGRDEEAVLEAVWEWERTKWRRFLQARGLLQDWEEETLDLVETALAAATLGRPFRTPEEAARFWEAHTPPRCVTPDGRTLSPAWPAQQLPALFPVSADPSGWVLPPIVPDPLADRVLRRRLERQPDLVVWALPTPEEAEARPQEAASAARRALDVLARLWEGAIDGRGREQVAGWMQKGAEHLASWPSSAWTALDGSLPRPDRTLALRPFLADFYRARLGQTPPGDRAERARMLTMLGWAFSALGRREEALRATEEAVRHYRTLAQENPQAFLPDLAMSLNNLGAMLSEVGRREEALRATEEAAGLYRTLAQENPQAFLPDLAMSLNNLGLALSALGRREEALRATEEAVAIRRRLAQENPQAFLPDLAMSLGAHGTVLRGLGRHKEAAKAFEEGLQSVLPALRLWPQALQRLADTVLQDYLRSCRDARRKPDADLVAEVQKAFSGAAD